MNVTPIRGALPGEAVVAIAPPLAADVDIGWWRRRLNLFTGRALSDIALQAEQAHRAGRLALLGQAVSPGVVSGLDVDLRVEVDGERRFYELYVGAGLGLAVTGEDVSVPRAIRVDLRNVPVHATAGVAARTLGALLDEGPQPIAGVFVLQPAVAELREDLDRTDPCEQDPEREAFEDWQLVDAARLVFVAWPDEWLPLPPAGARWRNRIAHAVFEREMLLGQSEVAPWAEVGVPIGLAAFAEDTTEGRVADWTPVFVDRFSVVRAGGRPRARSVLVPGAGDKFLWQARIEQLAEHMSDAGREIADIGALAAEFRYLPPVGLLPKPALDFAARSTPFFPSRYTIEALPIPVEQVDTAVRAAASLRHFDLAATGDRVQVLVPVPQVFYDPRLLEVDLPDPTFQTALDEFLAERAEWLQRRADVRARLIAIVRAINGTPPEFPPLEDDPEALEEGETIGDGALDPPEDVYGTDATGTTVVVPVFEALIAELRSTAPWSTSEVSTSLSALPAGLTIASLPSPFNTRIRYDAERQLLFLRGVTTTDQREQLQSVPSGNAAWESAILNLHQQSNADLRELREKGIEGFIPYLEGKIRRADDRIDFGFLRVQTDIYRLRQSMLGANEATRLATSPVLATIAKGETAIATREDLTKFFGSIKGVAVERPEGSGSNDQEYINYVRTLGVSTAPQAFNATGEARFASSQPLRSATATLGGTTGASGLSGFEAARDIRIVERATGGTLSDAGVLVPRVRTDVQAVEAAADIDLVAVQLPTFDDIVEQAPIVGETYDFRTATIAQRIESPPALEVKSFSVAGKYEVVSTLAGLEINLSDVPVAGVGGATFATLSPAAIDSILEGTFDPNPANGDEADFFARGVKALDDAVVTLRSVEGRVQQYRTALDKCRKVLPALKTHSADADRRLKAIADELAEARHDVSVGRALLAEETLRVDGINARRAEIIAKHVPFLAYVRPRVVDAYVSHPVRELNPGLTEAPVPACLNREIAVPPELRAVVDLLRELPVRWFVHVPSLIERFDRLDLLHGAVLSAKTRATFKAPGEAAAVTGINAAGKLGQGVLNVFTAQQKVVSSIRAQVAQIDLSAFAGLSWQQSRQQAEDVLSLGDLIDAGHGRTDVAQRAAREIDQIARVASCLYASVGDVLPRIRLEWAERLSQYDEPVTLRNLASLPRWGEIEYLDRREMQALVDWLYSRLDAKRPQGVALVSDIIRVCILLASHAPVGQIIAGHVPKPTVISPGGRVDVKVDLSKVKVGMHVLLYEQQAVVARGVVQDLASGVAAAHVLETYRPSVTLAAGARVQFSASQHLTGLSGTVPSASRVR